MTKKIWEKRLLAQLKPLSKAERKKILDYYAEMYGDRQEAGLSESAILAEFGSPEECAARILAEEGITVQTQAKPQRAQKRYSAAEIVGLFFVSLILILPLAICALALIIAFGATALAGAIVGVAGAVYALVAPLLSIGQAAPTVLAHLGMGLTATGVGMVLFVLFFLLTKCLALGSAKAFTFLYMRRNSL